MRKKKCIDSRRPSVGQQKSRPGGRLRQGRWRKSAGEQRHHPGQEQGAEAEAQEGAEHLPQLPQPVATLESAGRLEEASVAVGQQVAELAAALDGACEEEAEV